MAHAFSHRTSENNGLALENMIFVELRRTMENVFYYKSKEREGIGIALQRYSNNKTDLLPRKSVLCDQCT